MISIDAARQLLDFGSRGVDELRAEQQLEGTVALHNILEQHGVAYLADEVGMGKTLVALGVIALFRHFRPDFRVLVIAPRENIQRKWIREADEFFAKHVRLRDLRVRGIDGRSQRQHELCENLIALVERTNAGAGRDFFVRLPSFSIGIGGAGGNLTQETKSLRDALREELPWLEDDLLDLRNKESFKADFARAVCGALPNFDLVIVDEGHNLKHGLRRGGAARNQVLAYCLGHPEGRDERFPNYGSRCQRVLLLSATPVEDRYDHLANQLAVFDRDKAFPGLLDEKLTESQRRSVAAEFLIRRVTTLRVAGESLTRNLYRSEWRRGGVRDREQPITVTDDKQLLVVALLQKKVSELLGHTRFGCQFQVGMLASFESFFETTKVKRGEGDDGEAVGSFDGAEQAKDAEDAVREGVDVHAINRIARSHRDRFRRELPHPKMDALVDALAHAWETGEKALVFVRRVASVKEIKRKLDDRYDDWLLARLRRELPASVAPHFERLVSRYATERRAKRGEDADSGAGAAAGKADDDRGGTDTFFAWFFRGEGPRGVLSGANLQKRLNEPSGPYSTFFARNHVAELLGARLGSVEATLRECLGLDGQDLRRRLQDRARLFLENVKRVTRGDRFDAFQAAAVDLLRETPNRVRDAAHVCWQELFEEARATNPLPMPPELRDDLEVRTFFTELESRPALRDALWPHSVRGSEVERFRERQLRAELLASAARLGHSLIDLYVLCVRAAETLDSRERSDEVGDDAATPVVEYLDLLAQQQSATGATRAFRAFDELNAIATHLDLLLDVNGDGVRTTSLVEAGKAFGTLLGRQQPTGGMSGAVNRTLVRQFRMPGYPFVMITTDVLQEGEDLHTFCRSIYHYGIGWTPSAMEQRVGRVDRIRSLAHRGMQARDRLPAEDDKLQVYYPYLQDTIEVLQVKRVLQRMDRFLRLVHEDLVAATKEASAINLQNEFLLPHTIPEPPRGLLKTAFPVQPHRLEGEVRRLAVDESVAHDAEARCRALRAAGLPGLAIQWVDAGASHVLTGTVQLALRVQPFTLWLRPFQDRLMLRCLSPIGRVGLEEHVEEICRASRRRGVGVSAVLIDQRGKDARYDLAVQGDVMLGRAATTDAERAAWLVGRVVHAADGLEHDLLDRIDQPIETFRPDLDKESTDGG